VLFAILHAFGMFVADMFKSPKRLEPENLFLRINDRRGRTAIEAN